MTQLLGGQAPAAFLQRHWQKEPLLVRQAVPAFAGFLSVQQMFVLAAREDAVARLVLHHARHRGPAYELLEGPLVGLSLKKLPEREWTVLVQGIESLVPGGWELLNRFSFLPAARIDDLMVSYAAPGGSVGPHVDRYDVFLLQGPGRRRWQWGRPIDERDPASAALFDAREPIKILKRFVPVGEAVLEPGDMLYLPPGVPHHGVAVDACFTYSIGLVAPSHEALVQNFVAFLQQERTGHARADNLYEDPGLIVPSDRLAVPAAMQQATAALLAPLRFGAADIAEFLGRLLTGPKPHQAPTPRARPLSPLDFATALAKSERITLALPTRGLVDGAYVFINGERFAVDAATRDVVRELLTSRAVSTGSGHAATTRELLRVLVNGGHAELAPARALGGVADSSRAQGERRRPSSKRR